MNPIKVIKGYRPLHFVGNKILFSKGYGLYLADHACDVLEYLGDVPHSIRSLFESKFRLISRIFRTGVAPGCVLSDRLVLLTEKRRIWRVDLDSGRIDIDHEIVRGSRPLSISSLVDLPGFERFTCCYGEYWENVPKDEVRIWGREGDGRWSIAYTFPKGAIEHVHAIIPDRQRNLAWILTGDFNNSPGLWKATDNFLNVEPVLVGEQEYRCVWLFLVGADIYYATDSQLEKNTFRRLLFEGDKVSSVAVCSIPGSSIYSCVVGQRLIFSTTVEPGMPSGNFLRDMFDTRLGPGIESNKATLFSWRQGDNSLHEIATWEKDIFPPRLFQFGSLSFPIGINPNPDRLYAYATALQKYDECTVVFDLSEGSRIFESELAGKISHEQAAHHRNLHVMKAILGNSVQKSFNGGVY